MYRDDKGVLHFTNAPTSTKYRLYIKSRIIADLANLNVRSTKRYDRFITQASQRHGVSFPLVKAVIKAESDFNPRAVSKKGAKGLMQIMPKNFKKLRIDDPFNAWENIMGGTRYLKQMLLRYKGNMQLALAAYNAGPTAVDQYRRIPPYQETKQYVQKVLRYYESFNGL
jgi:soluble lytic murein transglycosylase